ncbi:hypothetical protein [Metabacillus sp. RGM 3146]|uniref:hypothetical protein n=1 Tax=Metabacillus sp. RGM 3146 TaxID=3401092 RepID=UPI003B9C9EAF
MSEERQPLRNSNDKNHPEQLKTEKKSQLDADDSEMNVDSIPLEDLKQDMKDEKNPHKTKKNSASNEHHPD